MPDVFVAAGSNVEPVSHLRQALDELQRIYAPLTVSPAYRNKAVGFEGEDFINLVIGFRTDDSIRDVRRNLQEVEKLCGRPADSPKWAPRTMDLDILLYDQLVSDEPGLILPRPDLIRRAYMLKPMADIAPDVMHPTLHKSMRDLWDAFDRGGHEMNVVELD
ncbi:MAG: 2-amino-4-hydroxy-6-hydroxymethyldihydropteridine diphosphokinase [Povalibacter sp.]